MERTWNQIFEGQRWESNDGFIIEAAEGLDSDAWPGGEWSPAEEGGYFVFTSSGQVLDRVYDLARAMAVPE